MWQKLHVAHKTLKCLLSDQLQKKFANPCSKAQGPEFEDFPLAQIQNSSLHYFFPTSLPSVWEWAQTQES